MQKSNDEWKKQLTPEQYAVLRQKGTEAPFSGKLLANSEEGTYRCGACGAAIFPSDAKFESDVDSLAGWPSFCKALPGAIELHPDTAHGMVRTEVVCATCGSHLGHLFDDPSAPGGQHYCINSVALDFKKASPG